MMRSTATEVYPGVSWRNHGPFQIGSPLGDNGSP
jgi:hypothetical protein